MRVEIVQRGNDDVESWHLQCFKDPETVDALRQLGVEVALRSSVDEITPDAEVVGVGIRRNHNYERLFDKTDKLDPAVTVLMLDWSDMAEVGPVERRTLLNHRIDGICKSKLFRDPSLYAKSSARFLWGGEAPGEHHRRFRACRPEFYGTADFVAPLPLDTNKLGLWPSSGTWRRVDPLKQQKVLPDKPIDVMFVGSVDYENTPIQQHRHLCCDSMERLPRSWSVVCHRGKVFSPRMYFTLSRISKIIVSPWGWGAVSYRDFETVFSASALLKPPSSYIKTFPDILPLAFTCRPDFSDLEAECTELLDTWNYHYAVLLCLRETTIRETSPQAVAAYFATLFSSMKPKEVSTRQ